MTELIETHWLLIVLALVIGVIVAWYVFHASRRTRVTGASRDVLDEGASPAERNRALIDAPPATQQRDAAPPPAVPPLTPAGLAGAGTAVSAATEAAQVEGATSHAEPGTADDLTRLKGVGPKLAVQLRELGVTRFAQIAAWDDGEIDRIDAQLGRFQGRIRRDDWVAQARLLDAGDTEGYARRFGNMS